MFKYLEYITIGITKPFIQKYIMTTAVIEYKSDVAGPRTDGLQDRPYIPFQFLTKGVTLSCTYIFVTLSCTYIFTYVTTSR
jgi:hypothetical protein